jgi:nucleoside-diphosphate kinase
VSSTFAILKPDAMRKKLAGVVISRIEAEDFTIGDMQIVRVSTGFVHELYAEHRDKPFFEGLCAFMRSEPVILMELQRDDAVAHWRRVLGATDSRVARAANAVFGALASPSLRGQYGNQDGVIWENVAHGSATDEDAKRELTIWKTAR